MAQDKTAALAAEARERAEAAIEAAQAALEAAQDAVEDGIDTTHRYLRRQWRERPVTVAAAALGAGVLIGLLLGSRR